MWWIDKYIFHKSEQLQIRPSFHFAKDEKDNTFDIDKFNLHLNAFHRYSPDSFPIFYFFPLTKMLMGFLDLTGGGGGGKSSPYGISKTIRPILSGLTPWIPLIESSLIRYQSKKSQFSVDVEKFPKLAIFTKPVEML